jgi:short-subunit dehydrogenase
MNVNSTTIMTHLVLPGMVARRRGAVVNIASSAGCHTMPLLAQYSAAKGYIAMFSRALQAECRGSNVTVQCQVPFYVATKLAKLRKAMTGEFGAGASGASTRRRGSMMTYKTPGDGTIMRVAGSATSAMRKPQRRKRVRNDEA